MKQTPSAFVSQARLTQRLDILAQYGATSSGGVNRQALTSEDIASQQQLIRWGLELGLEPSRDPAGNLFLRLPAVRAEAPPVMSGSHLDTQPTGGRFDGVYGVVAALEAVQAIIESGHRPDRPIDIVAWMNEEGSRFAPGMAGSAAFAGSRTLDEIRAVSDAEGITVAEALDNAARVLSDVPLRPLGSPVAAYVEAHIEQGPILEKENKAVGIVSGIQGKRTFRVTITGESAHAGTSTRAERKDALLAAVRCIQALTDAIHDTHDIVKFTVGRLIVSPNAPSVVPQEVVFSIDLRHPDSNKLMELGDLIASLSAEHSLPCTVAVEELSRAMSLEFDTSIRDRIRSHAERQGISHIDIPSAAGHDARYLNDVCPSGMIFVPCHLGITHNEAESARPEDLADGTRVLADVLLELASEHETQNSAL